ncbi:hypothetical protein [Clostridium sp. ZBS2]|uniref:hypothetical protein n=1 Tax=Clostridium sp. ZBS2 TaxID=2949976 RepID=UPI002079FE4B|nr:hypothetical protein [Clostridium sp. ZBS2]
MEEVKTNYYRNKIKLELCRKYENYIFLIYYMSSEGRGGVLQEQIVQGALKFRLDATKRTILAKLLELKKADIIKEIKYKRNSRIIMLRKFAKKYLRNEWLIDVKSVHIPNLETTHLKYIFRAEYFLKNIIPNIRVDGLREMQLYSRYCADGNSFIGTSEDYMEYFYESFLRCMNKDEVNKDIKYLQEKMQMQIDNMIKTRNVNISNGYELVTIETITNKKNAIIDEISENEAGGFTIDIVYLNYKNKLNVEEVLIIVSRVFELYKRIFQWNYKIYVNFAIACIDKDACIRSKNDLENKIKASELNKKYNINPAFLKFELLNFDITKKYFK